ncbi:MAG TPA: Rieske (2Fe-2S) protein [Candidatus Sulfotelmatobacter sp.]|nr:Rieske (2Fe-2S) protein [Candidatus Sulfotelmatobacter sp.]
MNSEKAATVEKKEGGTRRDYLRSAWKALGLVAAAEFAAVVGAFLWPRARGEDERGVATVDAGPVAEFTPASVTAFPQGRFYLVRLADGGFLALSSKCPHLGCTVPWNEKTQTFPCPCHASVFDMTGNVQEPPAPRALDLFPVRIEAGVVKVDTRSRVQRQRFERSQVTYL